jgi:hypothetical protein
MGLKDLIASKSSLAEDVIEEIVSEHVRYDTDHKAVFLTPEGHELSGKSKVLVYLVALQGWPFVLDDVVPMDAKPGEIEKHTGIPGGSLRPHLKELKDRRIIIEKGGRYSVLSAALQSIKKELGSAPPASDTRSKPKKRKARSKPFIEAEETSEIAEADSSAKKKTGRKSASKGMWRSASLRGSTKATSMTGRHCQTFRNASTRKRLWYLRQACRSICWALFALVALSVRSTISAAKRCGPIRRRSNNDLADCPLLQSH